MFKKLAFAAVCTFLFSFAKADNTFTDNLNITQLQQPYVADTMDTNDMVEKDSVILDEKLKQEIARLNPKAGFKDLFIPTALSNGMTVEQLNPMAVSFVNDYVSRFGKTMDDMKDWGRPYFDMMDDILTEYGLPNQLKYLAVIESHLKNNARSWAGAVGPWQFMPATARVMGLRVSRNIDERRDYKKSTHAAARYLTHLYELYGDWLLVIAAYNGGPGNVNKAIKRSGSKDFWQLQNYLPAESRNHVKKFIATHYIMEGEGGITTLTKHEVAAYQLDGNLAAGTPDNAVLPDNVKTQTITGRYNARVMAKFLEMDEKAFNSLNPTLEKTLAKTSTYQLKLPEDKMQVFLSKKNDILDHSIQALLNPDYKF